MEDETGSLRLDESVGEKWVKFNRLYFPFRVASKPDALKQLIQCFQRAATSEESQAISITNDRLFVDYAEVMASSVHIEEDDASEDEDKEVDQAEKEEAAQALRAEQAILADRGAAIMCLMYLSASNG